MSNQTTTRVAVYIDFDNIVISRYNQLHGKGQFQADRARNFDKNRAGVASEIPARLVAATVDIDAVLDFATSFGSIVLSRAYADWSVSINSSYQRQLIDRAVDLTQLFPTAPFSKNGADIRLAVDAVEDMFRLDDITHVVLVAGDSDYIALAQRCKRLGRYVVGIGVAGATSRALAAACDEFVDYDALPGQEKDGESARIDPVAAALEGLVVPEAAPGSVTQKSPASPSAAPAATPPPVVSEPKISQKAASGLLVRALRLGHAKEDADWLHLSEVKIQIRRIDPSFNEKTLGYQSFSEFVKSRTNISEVDDTNQAHMVRIRTSYPHHA